MISEKTATTYKEAKVLLARSKTYYENIGLNIFSLCILILLPLFSFSSSGDWNLKKNENGIEVYTRNAENSLLKEVRVITEVQSSLSAIVALLLDVKNYPKWIYACSDASTLNVISDHEVYHYQVTHLPWPLNDRDLIWHFRIDQEGQQKLLLLTIPPNPIMFLLKRA